MENFIRKENSEEIKGKAKQLGEFVIDSAMAQIGGETTLTAVAGIGLISGLAHGSFRRGVKTGLVALGVFTGAGVVYNVAKNWDEIKQLYRS